MHFWLKFGHLTIFAICFIFCNLFMELKSLLFTHKMFYHLKILLDIVDIYCNKRALFYMTNIFLKILSCHGWIELPFYVFMQTIFFLLFKLIVAWFDDVSCKFGILCTYCFSSCWMGGNKTSYGSLIVYMLVFMSHNFSYIAIWSTAIEFQW